MVKIGERIVVQGMPQAAFVESIENADGGRVIIHLDWKEFGKSRVYLHDEGTVWIRYSEHLKKN